MDKILLVEVNQVSRNMLTRHWPCQEYLILMAVDRVQDLLTAHTITWEQEQCRELGCEDNQTKPVELTPLLAKIPALLVQEPTP